MRTKLVRTFESKEKGLLGFWAFGCRILFFGSNPLKYRGSKLVGMCFKGYWAF